MLLQRSYGAPVSRIKSGYQGIRRRREPGAAHPYNVALRPSASTAGGYDASLGFQGVVGADAVCRQDSWRPQTLQVAPWRANCRRNTCGDPPVGCEALSTPIGLAPRSANTQSCLGCETPCAYALSHAS